MFTIFVTIVTLINNNCHDY